MDCSFSPSFPATELLKTLVSYEDVQHLILMRLVGILKASDDRPVPAAITGEHPHVLD